MGGFRRFGSITRVLVKHGLGDLATRLFNTNDSDKPYPLKSGWLSADRVRRVLEELGPSFIKLGQLLSSRADILPPDYIEELKKLQDRVAAVPYAEIEALMEAELQRPLGEIFEHIESEPLAAASVAQVHAATLFSGEKVAVKVVRPAIERKIRADVRVMYFLADRLEKTFELARIIGASNVVTEFERTIFKELDMQIEAGNIERFSRNFRFVDDIHIPKVHWEQTTTSVLVLEHIDGIKVDEVEQIRGLGIDPKEIAMIGLRSLSRQLMEFGYFHADPHPGNTLVMPDGRVGLVDFGIMGYLDEEMMHQVANLFLGYAEHDYDLVMEALLGAGLVDEDTIDVKAFRADLKEMSEPFYGRSLQAISVKDVYDQVIQLVLKYRIQLPRNMLLLFKTFIQTEALGKILGSDASILEVMKPYAKEFLQKGYESNKLFELLGKDARVFSGYLRAAPKLLFDILRRTAEGKQGIELRHTGFDDLMEKSEKGLNRLTVGIVVAASIIAAVLILNSSQKVFEFEVYFLGQQTVSITALLGILGYSVATILGVWLIISIIRSGKL